MNYSQGNHAFDFTSLPLSEAFEVQPLKPQLLGADLHQLFLYIWAHDSYSFDHPRYRLQVAFVILLLVHLGLHPNAALYEGLYYRDTQLLVSRHDGALRAFLIIRLDRSVRTTRATERWCGRTMILVDNPKKRHMCPVSLFLSMAIADGVIAGVNQSSDLEALPIHQWPEWTLLPYRDDYVDLSVLRRTGNKSRQLSSCTMKSPSVYKMMQAQIRRAGHLETYMIILRDLRNASHCERRRFGGSEAPMIIGRGHSESVITLIAPAPLTRCNLPWNTRSFAGSLKVLPKPYPLPQIVEVQLKYDITRLLIIAYLFGMYDAYHSLPDILWPCVGAAAATAYEPYYEDAVPDVTGHCAWCGAQPPRIAMKTHLLRCCQRSKNTTQEKLLTKSIQDVQWSCKWSLCTAGHITCAEAAATHMTRHMEADLTSCHWDACSFTGNLIDIQTHLKTDHNTHTLATIPTKARVCIECGIWILTNLDWSEHIVQHTREPHILYGPILAEGILAAPRRCPYCTSQGLYAQFENQSQYIEHIDDHISEELHRNNEGELLCPHYACTRVVYDRAELRTHFKDIHGIDRS